MDTPINTNQVSPSAHPHHITGGLHWPERFHHLRFPGLGHMPPKSEIINVNIVHDEQLTMGDKIADWVASLVGSWRFIISQSILLAAWITLNTVAWFYHWDNYPYVLLNLALSFQAAYSAPFIMMSQNRQAAKDRLTAENDYKTDMQGEEEIRHILAHLEHQDLLIIQIIERLEHQHQEILQRMNGINQLEGKSEAQEVTKGANSRKQGEEENS
jgi:uncharacterized membrane protein